MGRWIVVSSVACFFGLSAAWASEAPRIRTDKWAFGLLFSDPGEIALAHVTSLPSSAGDVEFAVDRMIRGDPGRATLRMPNTLAHEWRIGDQYLICYRMFPLDFYAAGKPTSELLDVLAAYGALRAAASLGSLPLDADDSFLARIRGLLPLPSPAGQLARNFVLGEQMRRRSSDPDRDCCDVALSLTQEDWRAIENVVRSQALGGYERSNFLERLARRAYLRNGPVLVAAVMVDWSRVIASDKADPSYQQRKDVLGTAIDDWIAWFMVPDRIAFLQLLAQTDQPQLVAIGKTLPRRPWFNGGSQP